MTKMPLITVLIVLITGCAGSAGGSCAAPSMGVVTDASFKVMDLMPNGPAEKAGMQVGDILLDVRLAQLAPGESSEAVPFSDIEAARALTSLTVGSRCGSVGRSVRLRVQRADKIIELYITPQPPRTLNTGVVQGISPLSPVSTPTPIPTSTIVPHGWYYF